MLNFFRHSVRRINHICDCDDLLYKFNCEFRFRFILFWSPRSVYICTIGIAVCARVCSCVRVKRWVLVQPKFELWNYENSLNRLNVCIKAIKRRMNSFVQFWKRIIRIGFWIWIRIIRIRKNSKEIALELFSIKDEREKNRGKKWSQVEFLANMANLCSMHWTDPGDGDRLRTPDDLLN